ncbi:tetratricopeptide repeat protein [Phytohabitans sp. LJ34]|uniref:AfsR/SARP family transcriptional regulator n=1 Tax=Phytohabitans sp. LJ34 TaxID=3452217 RepID=UPI003F89AC07
MEIRLLGPVEVYTEARLLPPGPPQQRRLLAALAADAGRLVTVPALIDRVWDEAPRGARHTLHVLITRLRAVLRDGDETLAPIVHRSGGYVLDVDPLRVDVHRFLALVASARGTDCPSQDRVEMLRRARALWRGDPLADVPGQWAARTRDAWRQQHLDAVLAWARAELSLGNPGAVIGPLTELAGDHPLVEPLAAALMRALAGAGRAADALQHYTTIRERLREQLGVDPGQELQATHRSILRGEPHQPPPPIPAPPRAVPTQLPADVPAFTGRGDEVAQVDALLAGDLEPTAVVITAVSGTPGVGKTALAVRCAHRSAGRFPDGQLYLNLRGYDPDQPVSPEDALARFLGALGVAGADIPLEVDERAAIYRTRIAGRRMLIVLDNAATVEQVRPLLPGTPTCAVLVTSRDSLAGLVAVHGAHRISLDPLPTGDAIALLRRLIGTRVDTEAGAAATLIEQCARLPLALRVAAEMAVSRPTAALSELVAELADRQQRLHLLNAGGDPRAAVTAVFSWSVRHLPPDAAAAFALLGLHPGGDFDAYAGAALAGTDLDHARRVQGVLARAHLVHPTGPGRCGMHDLLRAYATGLADDPRAALGRLFDYYLATAAAAMRPLYPAEAHYRPRIPAAATPVPSLADPDTARTWLDTELPNLVAVAAHAAAHGWTTHATRLAATLFSYLDSGHHTEALAIHAHARQAARSAGDAAGEAHALLGVGTAHRRLGHYGPAIAHYEQALAAFRLAGDRHGQARALNGIGIVERRLGQYVPAADHHEQALALFRQTGDEHGQANALNNLGLLRRRLGDYGLAADHHRQALTLYRQTGDQDGEAHTLNNLGLVEQQLGEHRPAAAHHQQALAQFRALGHRDGEASALDNLGIVHTRLGQPEEAIGYFQRALAIVRDIGERGGEAWVLNGLGEASHTAGRAADALTHHTAALSLATQLSAGDQLARAHAGLGRAHHTLGAHGTARAHYEQALATYTRLGMPDAEVMREVIRATWPD